RAVGSAARGADRSSAGPARAPPPTTGRASRCSPPQRGLTCASSGVQAANDHVPTPAVGDVRCTLRGTRRNVRPGRTPRLLSVCPLGPSWFELVRVTGRAPSQVARPWIRPGACYDARHPRPLGDGFRMSPRSPAFGTALVLVSSTFAGVSGLFIRELLVLGLAPLQVVYFSNSLVFLILL